MKIERYPGYRINYQCLRDCPPSVGGESAGVGDEGTLILAPWAERVPWVFRLPHVQQDVMIRENHYPTSRNEW